MTYNVVFALYEGFEELDFTGPFEVFGAARRIAAPEWRNVVVAKAKAVRGSHGLTVQADHTFESAPPADLLVVPGGQTAAAVRDEALVSFIAMAAGRAQYLTSVCTGAFLLHRVGALRGKRATTYWGAMENFRKLDGVTVVDDARWVHDGNVVTAAGVSAGLDMALYVVGQLLSPKVARRIQRYMEYEPLPPYQDVVV